MKNKKNDENSQRDTTAVNYISLHKLKHRKQHKQTTTSVTSSLGLLAACFKYTLYVVVYITLHLTDDITKS